MNISINSLCYTFLKDYFTEEKVLKRLYAYEILSHKALKANFHNFFCSIYDSLTIKHFQKILTLQSSSNL